jgi:CBS domain containing-hemolysin-like protein
MEGNRTSRRLLFFVNHPTLFVATALVGNNVANYVVSLAIVLASKAVLGTSVAAEMTATVLFTPAIFVYGELLPKNIFYQAPNRLLRSVAPVFIGFAVLFAPVSAFLWWLGRMLERLSGLSPTQIRLALAKEELGDVLVEGREAGILHPTQLELSRNFFDVATLPVTHWLEPVKRVVSVDLSMPRSAALERARALEIGFLPVRDPKSGMLTGYVSAVELCLQEQGGSLKGLVQPLIEIPARMVHGEAILILQSSRADVASVVNAQKKQLGIIRRESLMKPLLGTRLKSVFEMVV